MQNDTVYVKVVGCTGTIFINRPDQENMLTRAMIGLLAQALDDLYLEKWGRAIILTGSKYMVYKSLHQMRARRAHVTE